MTGTNLTPQTSAALMQMAQADPAKLARAVEASKQDAALARAASDFEAMFLTEMIKPMFDSVPVDDTFGGGKGEDVFRGFLINEYGKLMSAQGGIGLASQVKEALLRAQEGQNLPTTGHTENGK
jgi:Rod binding domain-containing protein